MTYANIMPVILAAGLSSRWGADNKLLTPIGNARMIDHVIATVAEARLPKPLVIASETLMPHLDGRAHTTINPAPEAGLSASLKEAVAAFKPAHADWMLVLLADMPFVTAQHIKALASLRSANCDAIASDVPPLGPPVMWGRHMIEPLEALSGDQGGGGLLRSGTYRVVAVTLPAEEARDIDTPADLLDLEARSVR